MCIRDRGYTCCLSHTYTSVFHCVMESLLFVIQVSTYVLTVGLMAYIKLSIASLFHREGGRGLFWYGVVTQIATLLGAVIGFYIVSYAKFFKSYDICNS